MRMWLLPPSCHCRKHLLGAHVECHMLAGAIRSGMDITGWLRLKFVDPSKVETYHNELAREMEKRGYKHNSPLVCRSDIQGCIDIERNKNELQKRCSDCAVKEI